MPLEVRAQRSAPASISSGASSCEPLELTITTELEITLRDVKPSGLGRGSRVSPGGAPGSVEGVNRHRKAAVSPWVFRLANISPSSGLKETKCAPWASSSSAPPACEDKSHTPARLSPAAASQRPSEENAA